MSRLETCCFTGHRQILSFEVDSIIEKLDCAISELIEMGVTDFLSGGARGFDLMAAGAVLNIKETNPQVKLKIVTPCENQDLYWDMRTKKIYRKIVDMADEVIFIQKDYDEHCMKMRNARMVSESAYCISYLRKGKSGTSQTVNMAKRCGLIIIEL